MFLIKRPLRPIDTSNEVTFQVKGRFKLGGGPTVARLQNDPLLLNFYSKYSSIFL